jgi:hypothetical protein
VAAAAMALPYVSSRRPQPSMQIKHAFFTIVAVFWLTPAKHAQGTNMECPEGTEVDSIVAAIYISPLVRPSSAQHPHGRPTSATSEGEHHDCFPESNCIWQPLGYNGRASIIHRQRIGWL